MRSISAADDELFTAIGGRRVFSRVQVKDSGGTWRDLTTYPGHNLVTSVTWKEDVDSNGMDAEIVLKREVELISAAPLMTDSPLNRGFNPAAAYAPLIDLAREVKIETAVVPDGSTPSAWSLAFHGYIDTVDAAGGGDLKVQASGLERLLVKEWIKRERIYAFAQGANALKGCYVFEPTQAYVLNELVVPSEAKRNAHFYKVTTAGTTAATEPLWATGSGSTTSSGTVVFTEVGATSTSAGTAVETVLQQILDDNLGAGVVTLTTPSSPGWSIRWFLQKREHVWAALRALVEQIGWDLRYRYDSGTASMKLKLIQPDRAKTTPDRTFAASEYDPPERLAIDIATLRNKVRVSYSDSQNLDAQKTPRRFSVEVSDSASIARWGEQYMEIQESDASNVDSSSEATVYATAAVSDMATPVAELGVPMPFFPFVELGDLDRFSPDGLHFSANQDLAVTGYEHSVAKDSAKTSLSCRGKPSSGSRRWLAKDGRVDPSDTHQVTLGNAALLTVASAAVVGGTKVSLDLAEGKHAHPGEYEIHLSTTAAFTASSSTLKATGRTREVTFADLLPGTTYYCQVIPFAYNKGRIVRGLPSAELSFVAGRAQATHLNPDVEWGRMPLNGGFETQFDPSAEPDFWQMAGRDDGVDGVWGTEGFVANANGISGKQYLKLITADSTNDAQIYSSFFSVNDRLFYKLKIWRKTKAGGANAVTVGVLWSDKDKSGIGSDFTDTFLLNDQVDAWVEYVSVALTPPAGARFGQVFIDVPSGASGRELHVDSVSFIEAHSHVRAKTASAGSYVTGDVVQYATEDYDTLAEYDTTTRTFTAKQAGFYKVSAAIFGASQSWLLGESAQLYLQKNSSTVAYGSRPFAPANGNWYLTSAVVDTVQLAVGDTLRCVVGHDRSAGNFTLFTDALGNYFAIDRLPD